MLKQFPAIGFMLLLAQLLPAQQPRLMLPVGHMAKITSVKVTNDGRKILSSAYDGSVKLWDVQSGNVLIDFNTSTRPGDEPDIIYFAAFSADEKMIVTTASEGAVTVWEVATGNMLARFPTQSAGYQKAARFSADQKHVFTFNSEGVTKWEIATKKKVINYRVNFSMKPVAVSPDDKKVVISASTEESGCPDFILDLATGKRTCFDNSLHSAWFDSSGNQLAVIYTGGKIDLFDKAAFNATGANVPPPSSPAETVSKAYFTADGSKAVVAFADSTVYCFNIKPGRKKLQLQNCKLAAAAMPPAFSNPLLAISPDGKKIAVAIKNFQIGIWNTETGRLLQLLKGHTDHVSDLAFFPDSRRLVTAANDLAAIVWDTESGQLVTTLTGKTYPLAAAHFYGNDKAVVSFNDTLLKVFDLAKGTLLPDLKPGLHFGGPISEKPMETALMEFNNSVLYMINPVTGDTLLKYKSRVNLRENNTINDITFSKSKKKVYISFKKEEDDAVDAVILDPLSNKIISKPAGIAEGYHAQFSDDENYLFHVEESGKLAVWEVNTGKRLFTIGSDNERINNAQFSPGGKRILGIPHLPNGDAGEIKIWETATGKLLLAIKTGSNNTNDVLFSPDGNEIIVSTGASGFSFYNSYTGKELASIKSTSAINLGWYSADGNYFMTSGENFSIIIWDAKSHKQVKQVTLPGYPQDITPDFKHILCVTNTLIHIYNTESGKTEFNFLIADSSNYVSLIPSGYYRSSRNAATSLYYVMPDLNIVSFDQLDVKYNRPDKVLAALGSRDTALISAYRNAYLKRIKKLDIDTTSFGERFTIPEADIENRNAIPASQTVKTLTLMLKAIGNGQPIDRYNIWVNEVPVYGVKGISLRNKNTQTISRLPVEITLSKGVNKIEFSVTGNNGIESYRKPLLVTCNAAAQQPEKVFFVGIGISQFADSAYNLRYCDKDITDLSVKLKQKYGDRLQSYILLNNKVTSESIKALKEKLQACTEEDKVIIAYSGHGLLSRNYDYYLSTYAVNFSRPEQNGLAYDELENLVDGIKSRKKLMLIDACHSGEIDKDDMQKIMAAQSALKNKSVVAGGKGIKVPVAQSNVGTKNSFDLMQELFVNVGKGTGTTIISAAAGTQFALERSDLKNGVFTYTILELINRLNTVTVNELKRYVNSRVFELTEGLQQPVARNEIINTDWKVW